MNIIKQNVIKNKHLFFEYLAVLLISCLATFYVFRSLHPTVPLAYAVDEVMFTSIFKVMLETGTPFPWYTNMNYGAPLGTNLLDYPNIDNLHFSLIFLLLQLFKDAVIAYNLYYLLTFVLTTLTAYFVLRKFSIPFFIALPGALAYGFLPYHIMRESHITLAGYFMVPLIILCAYQIESGILSLFGQTSAGKPFSMRLLWKSKAFWLAVILGLLFGFAGVYYAIFAAYMVTFLGLKSLVTKKYSAALSHFFMAGMIALSLLINLSPSIINVLVGGPSSISVGKRLPQQSEVYGLRIIQMLLPSPVHAVDSLRALNETYRSSFPNVNENQTSALGFTASAGFLLALIFLFTRQREDPLVNFLGFNNLTCFLLGTVGGFGALFALLVSPILRSYNRISVFIAFFAIATFSLAVKNGYLKYVSPQKDKYFKYILLVLLSGLVFFDQIRVAFPYNQTEIVENYVSDGEFVREIESQLPAGAMILQLPFMSYPESPKTHEMKYYDHLKVYLHSEDLRWSYGSMRGSISSEWNRRTAGLPVEGMVTAAAVTNFSGIQIDRDGYTRLQWNELENALGEMLQVKPVISRNGRLVFFDLQPYTAAMRNSLTQAEWDRFAALYGFTDIPRGEFLQDDEEEYYSLPCSGQRGTLTVANINKDIPAATISYEAVLSSPGEAQLSITSAAWDEVTGVSDTPLRLEHEVGVSRNPLDITFSCTVVNPQLADGSTPELAVRIGNIRYAW